MLFRCMQDTFSDALQKAQKKQTLKENIGELNAILIETVENGIKVSSADRNLVVESVVEAIVETPGSVLVSGNSFIELVKRFPFTELTVSVNEDNMIDVESVTSSYQVMGLPADTFPQKQEVGSSYTFEIKQNLFKRLVSKTSFSISQDPSRPVMTGALFEYDGHSCSMVTIDGYRLSICKAEIEDAGLYDGETIRVIIPGKTLQDLTKILQDNDSMLKISIDGKYSIFNDGYTEITGRLIEGDFIKYNQVLPKEYKTRLKLEKTAVFKASDRAAVITDKGVGGKIKFSVENDRVVITVNSSLGRGKETVYCDVEGAPIVFAINSAYLLDALRAFEEEEFYLELLSPSSPVIIKPIEGDEFLYLILPVRTE